MSELIETAAQLLGGIGIGFIAMGTVLGFVYYLGKVFFQRSDFPQVRLTIGRYTLLGLEFLVGQDIVETMLDTSVEHLVGLGAVVVIRTVLEHFIGKEVEHLSHEVHDHGGEKKTKDKPDNDDATAKSPEVPTDRLRPRSAFRDRSTGNVLFRMLGRSGRFDASQSTANHRL